MNGTINYKAVEEILRADYGSASARYRLDDEIEVTTETFRRVSTRLREICSSFPERIRVLDVGCGTGRYFHCLVNVCELVGIDITPEMLAAAHHPVRAEQVSAPRIQLLCTNAHLAEFPAESFELIYSFGMFGHGCPVTVEILNRFHQWLAPGGRLYFNTIDVAGLSAVRKLKRRLRGVVYNCLPGPCKEMLDRREARQPFFGQTFAGLKTLLEQSQFTDYLLHSRASRGPLWTGRHLECEALRTGKQRARSEPAAAVESTVSPD